MFIQGDGISADFASPPPVAELLWDSGDSDLDLPPPDVSALDPSLFDVDDDVEHAFNSSVAMSPGLKMSPEAHAAAAPVSNQAKPSFTANALLTAPSLSTPLALPRTDSRPLLATSDAAASNTDRLLRTGSIRSPASFVIHSKKQSLVPSPPNLNTDFVY